jgi:hypothetical protein
LPSFSRERIPKVVLFEILEFLLDLVLVCGFMKACAARRGNLTGFTEVISAKRVEKTGWDIKNSPTDISSSSNLGSCVSVKKESSFIG